MWKKQSGHKAPPPKTYNTLEKMSCLWVTTRGWPSKAVCGTNAEFSRWVLSPGSSQAVSSLRPLDPPPEKGCRREKVV